MPTPTTYARRSVIALLLVAGAVVATPGPQARAGRVGVGSGYAGISGEAVLTPGPRAAGRPPSGPPGVDVSHWQGKIAWKKVASSGIRYAYLKATEGTTYVDPTFMTNRAGARRNGIRVGAYHFASPGAAPGDAGREARFFVRTVDPRAGNLLPVLDIERTGGLSHAGVTRWIRRWVAEVRDLTGVTPMVYTSPYGWLERTGDSRKPARDGAPLWVAHWGVSSPTVPANGWARRGWVTWQWSSTGNVPGIAGDVDLDVVAGGLGRITIRRLSIDVAGGAGRVTSVPAGLGCRATCAHPVDPKASITLTAVPDDGAGFKGWSGACSGTDPTCTVRMGGNRSVRARFTNDLTAPTASFVRPKGFTDPVGVSFDEAVVGITPWNVLLRDVRSGDRVPAHMGCRSGGGLAVPCDATAVLRVMLTPKSSLVPGAGYEAVVNPVGSSPVTDLGGNPAPTSKDRFAAAASVEQTQTPLARRPERAWSHIGARAASGDSFMVSGRPGALARLTFDGVGVRWVAVTGPNRGRARVFLDGTFVRTVDLYAPARRYGVVRRFTGLAEGRHTIRIEVLGRARRTASDDLVAVDRLDVVRS